VGLAGGVLGLLAGQQPALDAARAAPATLADETIVGSNALVPPPVLISFTEGITVSDAAAVLPPAVISFTEGIGVSDSAVILPPARIAFTESAGVSDAPRAAVVNNHPPIADAGGPYVVAVGESVTLHGLGTDPDGDTLTFARDLDNNGTFETPGQNPVVQPTGGVGVLSIRLQVCDPANACGIAFAVLMIEPGSGGGGSGGGPPGIGQTPELDSILLYGSGLAGMAAFTLRRLRRRGARR